ncbi:MAG: hypothetical protein M5U12_18250 [Verrucomicrobia bacterium]|nr:hypothetical protein [Verrucomicrobiota bacterium]
MSLPVLVASEVRTDLAELARRLFWWKTPEEALAWPVRFLAQVMTWGTWNDLLVARRYWSDEDFRTVLRTPPPGVFDARSWSYWHCVLGIEPVPPLPQRVLP